MCSELFSRSAGRPPIRKVGIVRFVVRKPQTPQTDETLPNEEKIATNGSGGASLECVTGEVSAGMD